MRPDNQTRSNSMVAGTGMVIMLQEEVIRLENIIKSYRNMLLALNMAPTILDKIEDAAYNKEV